MKPKIIQKLEKRFNINFKEIELTGLPIVYLVNNQFAIDNGNVVSLSIRSSKIEDISFLQELPHLTKLDLNFNNISDISELRYLKNLKYLSLWGNKITNISILKKHKKLKSLFLYDNKITDISIFKNLKTLEELSISRNPIINYKSIKELINLRLLFLDLKNKDIHILKKLHKLERLAISNSDIADISILNNHKKLIYLNLEYNKISDISALKDLIYLRELVLDNNLITNIAALKDLKNLEMLLFRDNPISILPKWITDFPKMNIYWRNFNINDNSIYLYNNPITEPPLEIVKQGKDAIKNYFEQKEKYGTEKVYEAKILVVGEPEAGKTSLIKKILNEKHEIPLPKDKKEKSTLGIEVQTIKKFQYNDNIKIKTNIWDFGGQDIQYSLHQYFISDEALYILVSDYRPEKTRFSYWFQTINTLGSKKSRVIVLLNKFKDATSVTNPDIASYKRDFPNLEIETAKVDLSKNDDDWKNFKELTATKLSELSIVGQDGIKIWNKIRGIIEKKKEKGINYISLEGFYDLAKEMKSEDDINLMLDYFHKIGVVIYFKDDTSLQSDVFLNPNWITRAIYDALSLENKEYKNGQFSKKWLFNFWKEKGYKKPARIKLLSLMEADKFDICYKLPNSEDKYVVPLLLPDKAPEYGWNNSDNLQLQYDYDQFMPEGILSQLIVKTNQLIAEDDNKKQIVWKTGVVLSYKNTLAEIREHTNGREIHIKLQGENKSELRGIIMYFIDSIIKRFPKQPKIKIPCNCLVCKERDVPHFFKYSNLLERKARGVESAGECENSYQQIKIIDILEDYKIPERGEIIKRLKNLEKGQDKISKQIEKYHLELIESLKEERNKINNDAEYIKYLIKNLQGEIKDGFTESLKQFSELLDANTEEIKNELKEKYKDLFDKLNSSSNSKKKIKFAIPLVKLLDLSGVPVGTVINEVLNIIDVKFQIEKKIK